MLCCFPEKDPQPKAAVTEMETKATEVTAGVEQMTIRKTPFMIGIAGGPCSGKKEIAQLIQDNLGLKHDISLKVLHIPMENFYKTLSGRDLALAQSEEYNFDHPNAVDFPLLLDTLKRLKRGERVDIPEYGFQTFGSTTKTKVVESPDVILISGILILYDAEIRELLNLKIFADVDDDSRLSRLVIRDTQLRYQKSLDAVLHGYIKYVKPAFEEFVMPTKKFADVIIPRGETNEVAIQLLTQHIDDILEKK
jgi:uridine kinase